MTPPKQFTLKDEPIENQHPLKVRVIGAGYSGIYLGIRIPQRLRNIDLKIYEKNEGVGGTWWENRYPGCACDIPSHSYQFSFDPNPNWSSWYAPGEEICDYLKGIADKYGVMRYVKLRHKILGCKWDDDVKKWNITIKNLSNGDTIEDDADILISARGFLNDIAWPRIDGLNSFEGEVMHSAAWNQNYDCKNKKIGVIGGGSSAIQIIPSLQKVEGTHLTCFVRSKTWIATPFGDNIMLKLGLNPNQFDITPEQRKEFANNPQKFYKFRKEIEVDGNSIHDITFKDSAIQKGAVEGLRALMKYRLAKKPEIAEILTPSFGVGCRRVTPGPGYLEALAEDNVDFVSEEIKSITAKGVILESGRIIDIDALVCATGFNPSAPPPFSVEGKNGVTLEDKFTPFPRSYLSVAVDDFPNFFLMLGPNSAIGSGSLTRMLEADGDYIIKCIRKLQKEDYLTMSPKPSRVKDFTEYCHEYFKKTVYMDACNSWYKSEGGQGDRVTGLWPGSTCHCIETLRAPRWEDFDFESREENKLRWLGNGWSVTQLEGNDPAWYIDEEFLDIPKVGKPEEDERLKKRSFSY